MTPYLIAAREGIICWVTLSLIPVEVVFDWLEVHINSKTRQTIDEIRLGTTWSSVTAPWSSVPVARKEAKP